MKRLLIYIVPCLFLFSCNDFLTNKDKDKIIPKDANHFKELVFGELIKGFNGIDTPELTDIMSDDMGSTFRNPFNDDIRKATYAFFTWQQNTEITQDNKVRSDENYYSLYNKILVCNSVETLLEDVKDDPDMRNMIYGEIHFMRAYTYFMLANAYGKPYVDGSEASVPLNTSDGIANIKYERSTNRVIYDKMEQDIDQAIAYFTKTTQPVTIYRPSLEAAYILATRVYLAQGKYDKVIEFANKLTYENLYSYESHYVKYGTPMDDEMTPYVSIFNHENKDIVFTFGSYTTQHIGQSSAGAYYVPSEELMRLFADGDMRGIIGFRPKGEPVKLGLKFNGCYGLNMRLSEALVNRAEAKFRLNGDKAGVAADLNLLRMKRFSGDKYVALTANEITEEFIKEESRREFCFEGMRWANLRRWGMPAITHEYTLQNGGKESYVLHAKDVAYTLELPLKLREQNDMIERINRPVRSQK